MNNNTSGKKAWLKFCLVFGPFAIIWFFIFYMINRMINNVEGSFYFGMPYLVYWPFFFGALVFGLTTWAIYFSIREGIRQRSFQDFARNMRTVFRLATIPILFTLPFLYLGVTNAIVMTDEKIILDKFWSLQNVEYKWDKDVAGVEISYGVSIESNPHRENVSGMYIVHFRDGKKIELWTNTLGGNTMTIEKIDSHIKKKNIPFFVTRVPTEEMINKYFSDDADFIRELYSR